MVIGTLVGIAIAVAHVPYIAGAARSLANDAQRVVGTGGTKLISAVGRHGAPRRALVGLTALVAVLIPGVTAVLLVVAARGARRLRSVIAALLVALGIAAFAYEPGGHAVGVVVLALAVAAAAVALTGPLVLAPLCALAGLIGGEFLPRILASGSHLPNAPVSELHFALFGTAGASEWLRVIVLVVAAVPFALGARLVIKR